MKDYANRSFKPQPSHVSHVPIPWRYLVAAFVALLIIYTVSQHVAKQVSPKAAIIAKAKPAVVQKQPVKFDFYQMLTKNQANGAVVGHPADAPVNSHPSTQYFVQVGSEESQAVALQQKANLILSGLNATLLKVVKGAHGHYRLALGPYSNLPLAAAEQTHLKQSKINGLLVNSNDLKK